MWHWQELRYRTTEHFLKGAELLVAYSILKLRCTTINFERR